MRIKHIRKRRLRSFTRNLFSIPNKLTISRIFLTPVILILLIYKKIDIAFYMYVLSALTDLFDGLIARKFHQESFIGKILDPLADKIMGLVLFVALSFKSLSAYVTIPAWLSVIVIYKNIIILAGIVSIYTLTGKFEVNVKFIGKMSIVFEDLTVFLVLLFNYLGVCSPYMFAVYIVTLILSIASGYSYIKEGIEKLERG